MLLNWHSSIKEKIEKDYDDFWHRKMTLKVKIWHFLTKFNNFLWVCWFLGKHLSNFVPPSWKLVNPYYHICCIHLVISFRLYFTWLVPIMYWKPLKCRFCKKLLLYEWNSGQLNTFEINFGWVQQQNHPKVMTEWKKVGNWSELHS